MNNEKEELGKWGGMAAATGERVPGGGSCLGPGSVRNTKKAGVSEDTGRGAMELAKVPGVRL